MRIKRISLTTTEQALDLSSGSSILGKVLLRASGNDVRIALTSGAIALGEYFTVMADQSIVLDAPLSGIRGNGIFYLASATGSAIIEIWTTGEA